MNSTDTSIDIANTLRCDIEKIDRLLNMKDSIRESAYRLVREMIRSSSEVVSFIHRELYIEASKKINLLKDNVNKLKEMLKDHPDLYYSGMIYNGLSEFVEAYIFYSIVVESRIPAWEELGVPIVPYLQGLGDVIGEIRRLIIKLLNKQLIEEVEKYLRIMESIYENLRVLNYPDALIPGLRHKVDLASKLIDETKILILNTKNSLRCAIS
ncbi:MAG: haloacid dehalogenase [Desulfurococcaceae archaeon]